MKEKPHKIVNGQIVELSETEIAELNQAPSLEDRKKSLKSQLISIRKKYLKETADYYMPDFPEEILEKRALARQQKQEIEAATTLTALNNFDVNFE